MNPEARAIEVTCPNCEARYLLPAHLLFPTGSRVRCPGCSQSFDVPPSPGASDPEPPPAPESPPLRASAPSPPEPPPPPAGARPGSSPAGAETTPGEVARGLLEALAAREGEEIERSAAEGRLFARFGPAIFATYDEYRRRMKDAGPGPFRIALQERWGVELPEITPRF